MRILMICHYDAPWTPLYARSFLAHGHAVKVLSFSPGKIEGVDVEFIGNEPYSIDRDKHVFLTRLPRINRTIREFKPDLLFAGYVISNGLSAVLAKFGGPVVLSAQGSDIQPMYGHAPSGWKHRLRQAFAGFVCRRATRIHAVSPRIADAVERLGVSRDRIDIFATGVDLRRFQPDPAMPRPQGATLVCTRKHRPIYDNATIIEACGRLKAAGRRFKLLMVGSGELTDTLREQARRVGAADDVEFTGNRPHYELPGLLRSADVYLSASLSDGTSASLLEALASGLFPVVSRIPANEAWVTDGRSGLMFDCGNVDQLAAALTRAIDDAELRRSAFETNRRTVERDGDFDQNMQKMEALLARAMENRRP